jgi:serine/threonine protein kinase
MPNRGGATAAPVSLSAANVARRTSPPRSALASHAISSLDDPTVVPRLGDHPGPTDGYRGIERVGDFVGPYKLLEVVGEGGFGVVYIAERREPMVQRVALKVIKPGMDTRSVVARFEQERQALAIMDHPNVARVFDAGTSATGRPYFVMEYVRGDPITRYCDRERLTIRQRDPALDALLRPRPAHGVSLLA